MRYTFYIILALALPAYAGFSEVAYAKGGSHYDSYGVQRSDSGKIKRSSTARNDFKKQNPCPSTGSTKGACPGYVIDHVQPLKRGGADSPYNMQWQTKEEAKAKDKWE